MRNTQSRRKPARCGDRFKKAHLLADGFNQRHRKPVVTRKETRRQRHAREPTTGAKVGDLAATVGDQALNVRSSDKRVKQVSRCALTWIADAREIDCWVPCIK